MPHEPALLRKGWPDHRVQEKFHAYARAAIASGLDFSPIADTDRPSIEQLMNSRLASEFSFSPAAGGFKATLNDELAGAVVIEGFRAPSVGTVIRVRAIAVEPSWERQGLASVLLGMVPSVTPDVKSIHGGCTPDAALFYQRAGYDVLQPGENLPLDLGTNELLQSSNPDYPCWFIRQH